MGRKKLPDSAYQEVLDLVAQGMSVTKACEMPDTCCEGQFYVWLADDEDGKKNERYARATEARAAREFEKMNDIADDAEEDKNAIAKARLRIDTRKWTLAKMSPNKYGDKLDVNHGGNVIVEIKK